jgi:hypothetical protein
LAHPGSDIAGRAVDFVTWDFYSPDEVKSVYYPEVERLLRDTLGASGVVVFDHGDTTPVFPGAESPRAAFTMTTR